MIAARQIFVVVQLITVYVAGRHYVYDGWLTFVTGVDVWVALRSRFDIC